MSQANEDKNTKEASTVTLLGLGSLLSETSSRLTFPNLTNFRLGRVPHYRRVFGHPAPVFFENKIANKDKLQMSSLCAEPHEEEDCGGGFVCSVFDVPREEYMDEKGEICQAFRVREEEFDIRTVPFLDGLESPIEKQGILCCRWTDEAYLQTWGKERFQARYGVHGIDTIWGWKRDSGLKPCHTYLRHCLLAAKNMGKECHDSFLEETFLVDRKTTLKEYMDKEGEAVMNALPPPHLAQRYGG